MAEARLRKGARGGATKQRGEGRRGGGGDRRSRAELEAEICRLRAVEARALAAAGALPDGLAVFDAEDRLVYHNARYPEHLLPSLRARLKIGRHFAAMLREAEAQGPIYHPDMGPDFLERRLAMRAAGVREHEHRIVDGRWLRIRESPTPDGGRILVTTDVTEAHRRAEELRVLASAVEQIGDSVEITGATHDFVYVNRAFEETTGWPRAEALGRHPQDVLGSGVHPPEFFEAILARLEAGESWQGVIVNRRRDGPLIEQETTISPLRDEAGRISHYVAVKRDVTAARAHARALADSEARYRALVETQTELILRIDPEGRYTFMNAACERHYGMTVEEADASGLRDPAWLLPEDAERYEAHLAGITPATPTRTAEWRGRHPVTGRLVWEQWTDTGVFDEAGRLIEIQCVGRDVTDRKTAEQALAEREAQFRAIAESVPVGIIISEIETARPLYINPRARQNLGFGDEEALPGSLIDVWVDPGQRRAIIEAIARGEATAGIEAELRMPDGRAMTGLVSAARIGWAGKAALLAVTVDITEQRRTEAMLRDSEARLRAFMDFAPVAAHLRDREGRYLMVNREMEKVLGMPAETALDRFPSELVSSARVGDSDTSHRAVIETGAVRVSEDHLEHIAGPYRWAMTIRFPVRDEAGRVQAAGTCVVDISERKAAEANLLASEARLAAIIAANPVAMNIARLSDRKLLFVNEPYLRMFGLDGTDLDTYDRDQLYADPADRDWIYAEIAAGREVTNFELTLLRTDGTEVPTSITSRAVDFQGEPALVTSSIDLTNLRAAEAELARSREALHQSEKLTALGSLLAGVAHELNNPLSVVVGYSAMLKDLATEPGMRTRVERVHAAAERCARIVRSFLAMARARPPRRGPVELGAVVESALDLAAYGLRSADVAIAVDLDPDLPPVWGDADQLHQVVLNLVVNAQHALTSISTPRRLGITAHAAAEGVVLEVADNGPGMNDEVAKRAFEPFYTTKPQGVGTGVGLSVVHGVISAHGGTITLRTAPGEGARFRMILPAAAREADAAAPEAAARPAAGRVLVVDDEPDIAELLADHLRGQGFVVATASSGRRAINALRAAPFDAVVSDLRMPDMDGVALASAIAAERPGLARRLLIVTGDALGAGIGSGEAAALAGLPVFEKPLDLPALTATLRRLVAEGRA